MITEKQKYLSGIYKNIGFAFFTPTASIIFQWFVFEKGPYLEHFIYAIITSLAGFLFLTLGYRILEEKVKHG